MGSSPFSLLRRMMEDMDRLFGDFGFGGGALTTPSFEGGRGSVWAPQMEVYEREGKLHVRADLPGLKAEDINVNVEDDVLTVSGERRDEREEQREGWFHSERSYGRFERSLALPRGVDPSAIECKFENGVLSLEAPLPKQAPRGRSIPIGKSGGELPKETKGEKPH